MPLPTPFRDPTDNKSHTKMNNACNWLLSSNYNIWVSFDNTQSALLVWKLFELNTVVTFNIQWLIKLRHSDTHNEQRRLRYGGQGCVMLEAVETGRLGVAEIWLQWNGTTEISTSCQQFGRVPWNNIEMYQNRHKDIRKNQLSSCVINVYSCGVLCRVCRAN